MQVRDEQPSDVAAISAVVAAAFPTDLEARLVGALRHASNLTVSLVAEEHRALIGHIAFSPVALRGPAGVVEGLGLAPVAVSPHKQKSGVGSALIRTGLERCRSLGAPFVVVLGAPDYYRRFGFEPAYLRKIGNEYGARDEFMLLELAGGTLPEQGGIAQYCKAFSLVG
ncbi:MAG: putative acetyltransferase [Panacagrimonas sp.]|jgi:putative acetyltransferase|nr:N-acetyltransferase [Panacagrimonas sp.]MCC2658723.1 putative acetyltransferase [Panacagrimonas sp.]